MVDRNLLKFYKISSNDVICARKFDQHLFGDDVIVEVFVVGLSDLLIHLVLTNCSAIYDIILILETYISDISIIDIWDINGNKLSNDRLINTLDIDGGWNRILINTMGDFDISFDQCCHRYDQYLMGKYWRLETSWIDISMNRLDEMAPQRKHFEELFLSLITNDPRLDEDLLKKPPMFVKCKLLFSVRIADWIFDICGDYWTLMADEWEKRYDREEFYNIYNYFQQLLYISIIDKLDQNQSGSIIEKITLKTIIIEAIHCIIDVKMTWQYLVIFCDRLLLGSYNEVEMRNMMNDVWNNEVVIDLSIPRKYEKTDMNANKYDKEIFTHYSISKLLKTCNQAKKAISLRTGVEVQDLVLVQRSNDQWLQDDDKLVFDKSHKYLVLIINKMEDIELLKEIGHGSFGNVYLFRHKISRNTFVLKKPKTKKDLDREIHILSTIMYKGSNYDLYREKDLICLAMKYLPGGSLTDFIEKHGPLQEREISHICSQLLDQLSTMSYYKIIHRDIKCDNVVFDENGYAMLIDFGWSKCMENVSPDEQMEKLESYTPGTHCYMAPEIINCEKYDESADIWSLGAMVIEMVTGERPYPDCAPFQAAGKIALTKSIPMPSVPISNELKVFLTACLQPDPKDRPTVLILQFTDFITKYCIKSSQLPENLFPEQIPLHESLELLPEQSQQIISPTLAQKSYLDKKKPSRISKLSCRINVFFANICSCTRVRATKTDNKYGQ